MVLIVCTDVQGGNPLVAIGDACGDEDSSQKADADSDYLMSELRNAIFELDQLSDDDDDD